MRILRVVRSLLLPCGCFVGAYETYEGRTVRIVEEPGSGCPEPNHRAGTCLPPERTIGAGVAVAARLGRSAVEGAEGSDGGGERGVVGWQDGPEVQD